MLKTTAPIIGPILAGTLALGTAFATPVQAGNDDIGKVLLGLTALTILGAALADKSDAQPAPVYTAPPPVTQYHYNPPPVRRYNPPPVQRYDHSSRHDFKRLPEECRLVVVLGGRKRAVYGKACLQRNIRNAGLLPRSCERQITAFGRKQDVYYKDCLKDNGWQT